MTSSASGSGVAARSRGRLGGLVELLLAAGDEQDGGALGAEALRDVEPDAAAGAGHDAGLAGEAEVHVPVAES